MYNIKYFLLTTIIVLFSLSTFVWSSPTTQAEPTDSPAMKADNLVFISGQGTGSINDPDPSGAAIEEAFQKIRTIANQMGGDLSNVVKLTVYLADLDNDYPMLNEVVPKYFKKPYPARSTIGVAKLPKAHRVEIDAIMYLKS